MKYSTTIAYRCKRLQRLSTPERSDSRCNYSISRCTLSNSYVLLTFIYEHTTHQQPMRDGDDLELNIVREPYHSIPSLYLSVFFSYLVSFSGIYRKGHRHGLPCLIVPQYLFPKDEYISQSFRVAIRPSSFVGQCLRLAFFLPQRDLLRDPPHVLVTKLN